MVENQLKKPEDKIFAVRRRVRVGSKTFKMKGQLCLIDEKNKVLLSVSSNNTSIDPLLDLATKTYENFHEYYLHGKIIYFHPQQDVAKFVAGILSSKIFSFSPLDADKLKSYLTQLERI